ncbi:MAG: hypothetical protein HONBIEJF_00610 [Fimbriimonadaceae bacterium]|nr:hypothetical protein [Fimbriimonadaceae bacterium]
MLKNWSTFGLLGLLICSVTIARAETIHGEMILTHGYVVRDGVRHSVAGMRIPYTAERVIARRFGDPLPPAGGGSKGDLAFGHQNDGTEDPAEATAYLRDNGDGNYYINGMSCPSALDDVVMASQGDNQPWKKITMGIHNENGLRFLIRWQVYDTYEGGHGANSSAWYPFPLPDSHDFGGYVNDVGQGTWKVTFDISIMGCRVADGEFGLGTQFRTQQANGEGPFIDSITMVFCDGASTIGSTEDMFWFDFEPTNGIYVETEAEQFETVTASSFLLGITVGGTVHTVQPDTYTITAGNYVSGNLTSLKFSNNSYLVINVTNRQKYAQLVVESDSPDFQPLGYTFRCESASNRPGLRQKIDLWNYEMNRWDLFNTAATTTVDTIRTASVGSNPVKYVDQTTGRVKARITWENVQTISDGLERSPGSQIKVDLTDWQIVTP